MLYLFIHYIPDVNRIAKTEAKKLAKYLFDNFSEEDRLLILTEMRGHLIDLITQQIKGREIEIERQVEEIGFLKTNLNKLENNEQN